MCTYVERPCSIFSFYIENVGDSLSRRDVRGRARVKRSGVYSRINSDDEKAINKWPRKWQFGQAQEYRKYSRPNERSLDRN